VKLAGMVSCPMCGSTSIEKTLMAPRVQTARKAAVVPQDDAPQDDAPATKVETQKPVSAPAVTTEKPSAKEIEAKITALKTHIEKTSDYVGEDFAKEARAMHEGETPERSIYGEAKLDEAVALIEDGVKLAPLPFIPVRKTN
jgi:hypothetical protein